MKSLDLLLIRHTNEYLIRHHGHGENFAAKLRDAYEQQVPNGTLRWSSAPAPSQRLNSDYVKVKRYLDRERPLPAALVGPWLSILPEHIRDEILAEFGEGFGKMVLTATASKALNVSDTEAAARWMQETSEAFAAVAELLRQGDLSASSVRKIRKALIEVGEADTMLEHVRSLLVNALPTGDVVPLKKAN